MTNGHYLPWTREQVGKASEAIGAIGANNRVREENKSGTQRLCIAAESVFAPATATSAVCRSTMSEHPTPLRSCSRDQGSSPIVEPARARCRNETDSGQTSGVRGATLSRRTKSSDGSGVIKK
eukprot:3233716-Prymnesium_polylepis.2